MKYAVYGTGYGGAAPDDANALAAELVGFMLKGKQEAYASDWCQSSSACNYEDVTAMAVSRIESISKMPEVQANPINGVQPMIDYASQRMSALWKNPAPRS